MEGGESTESLNEWEQVQLETVSVKNDDNQQDDLSIFPPSYHEGLQVPPSPSSPADSQISVCNAEGEAGLPLDSEPKVGNEIGKLLRLRFEILRSGIVWIASRACSISGFWSFPSVSVVAVIAALMYWKVQRWRQWAREESEKRVILLIKEKDKKINQLLLQIAQMNEMLTARRKVPIIRVG